MNEGQRHEVTKKMPLGIAAEQAVSNFFPHMKRMPAGNPGYDFLWRKNKIDVKSACLHNPKQGGPSRWLFQIRYNKIADYFLCVAFDDNQRREPLHIWMIPGNTINNSSGVWIKNTPEDIDKWSGYEKSLDNIATAMMDQPDPDEQNALIQVSMSPDCREWWWSMPSGTRSDAVRKLIRKEIARKEKKVQKA
jgi:hypothetical protein